MNLAFWSLFAQHEWKPQSAVLPSILFILTFLEISGEADPPRSVRSDCMEMYRFSNIQLKRLTS